MQIDTIDTAAAAPALASFTIEPGAFAAAAAFLAKRVVAPRQTYAALATIHLAADPAGLVTLTATDLDNMASVTLPATVDCPGALCIEADALAAGLAKLKKGGAYEIRLQDEGEGRAAIKAGRTRFALKTHPVENFPVIAPPIGGNTLSAFTMPAPRFLADLAALAPCQSTEPTRYYLNGVAMQARDMGGRDSLVLVATDGSNMAVASRPLPAGAESLGDVILPRAAVAMLGHAAKLAGPCEAVAVECDGERARFTLGNVTLSAKLIDGTYPDWQRPFADGLAPIVETEAPLFPELIAGTPIGPMAKLEKAAGQPIEWQEAAQGKLGAVPGDPGLLFACMNVAARNEPVKGYFYSYDHGDRLALEYLKGQATKRNGPIPAAWGVRLITGDARYLGATIGETAWEPGYYVERPNWEALVVERHYVEGREVWQEGAYSVVMPRETAARHADVTVEIEGDATVYPIAVNSSGKIHLTAEQVRRMAGEVDTRTIEVKTRDGRWAHVYAKAWEGGALAMEPCTASGAEIRKGFACFTQIKRSDVVWTSADGECGETVEPEAVQEAATVECPEICPQEGAESDCGDIPALDAGEALDALHGAEIAPLGFFVIDTAAAPVRAVSYHADYDGAMAERNALEPKATFPGNRKTDGKIWRYMVTAETGPNDCRADLRAITLAYHADLAAAEPVTAADELPAPALVKDSLTTEPADDGQALPDPVAELAARVAALEATISNLEKVAAPLSAEPGPAEGASGGIQDQPRPKRTPAHERAIRRAWAERRARREDREPLYEIMRGLMAEADSLRDIIAEKSSKLCIEAGRRWKLDAKRRSAVLLARQRGRDMAAMAKVAHAERAKADAARADLDNLRARLVDPECPESESCIVRLTEQRDQARAEREAALSRITPLSAEVERLKRLASQNAGHIEALASRAAVAERMLREAGLAKPLPAIEPVQAAA